MRYYGLDLAKEKFDVNYLNQEGRMCSEEVKNNIKGISKFLMNLSDDVVLCAEHTGSYGELLLFLCNQSGISIAFVSGYTIKHSLGLIKGKSDPVDAKRIREYAERFTDKLTFSVYDNENLTELRELFVTRKQLVKSRKQIVTAMKSTSSRPMQSISAHRGFQTTIDSISVEIEKLENEIQCILVTDDELYENYTLATSIIGVGPVLATQLIIKTGNFKVINTARKAASFAGVCPFPNSSGKMVAKSKTSFLADKDLKATLHMAARTARMHNINYNLYYTKKEQEGKPYFLILNNISNKLLRTIYSVVQNKKEFDKNHICIDPRENKVA